MTRFFYFTSSTRSMKKSVILVLCIAFYSCSEDSTEPQIVPEVLVESTVVTNKSRDDIEDFIKSKSLPISSSDIVSSVTVYKIVYKTKLNGNEIMASGLVSLPDTQSPVAMVSFQHGTIAANSEAPTMTPVSSDLMMFYASMAAPGFIGVAPDLIGFGASKDVLHPYYLLQPTADAVVDCLKAARELALTKGLNFNERLFLAGYSQGGYATMAAHQKIEQSKPEHFNLIASFPSSGGYDVKGVQEYFFEQTEYDQPFYLAYVALAYKTHMNWSEPLTDLFQEPYASRVPDLFDGTNTSGMINSQLTNDITELIQADILANIDTDPKYDYLTDALSENSPINFVPKAKMFMYHGDLDVTVPYQNSVDVYNHFIGLGASTDVVTFTPLPYATHPTGVTPYLVNFIRELMILK